MSAILTENNNLIIFYIIINILLNVVPGRKDYAVQAAEYFSEKLAQYGEGTEVPIRSLLGHRSQASPEVRHVSGQHFHEFREFLLKHTDHFVIDDENETVILKDFSNVKSHSQELHFNLNVNIDPEVTQTLLDFFAQCIEVKGPILVEQLFQIVSCNLPEEMWTNLFNTAAHLTSFLRLFSDSFHIQSNLVTLLQHPKVSQKHINAQIVSQNQQQLAMTISKNNKETKNITVKEKSTKNVEEVKQDKLNQEVKNAKNLESKTDSNLASEYIEKTPVTPLSPKSASISDRLRQPKLQQRLQEAKAKSPEPLEQRVMSPTNSEDMVDSKTKAVSFRLGKLSCILFLSLTILMP